MNMRRTDLDAAGASVGLCGWDGLDGLAVGRQSSSQKLLAGNRVFLSLLET